MGFQNGKVIMVWWSWWMIGRVIPMVAVVVPVIFCYKTLSLGPRTCYCNSEAWFCVYLILRNDSVCSSIQDISINCYIEMSWSNAKIMLINKGQVRYVVLFLLIPTAFDKQILAQNFQKPRKICFHWVFFKVKCQDAIQLL